MSASAVRTFASPTIPLSAASKGAADSAMVRYISRKGRPSGACDRGESVAEAPIAVVHAGAGIRVHAEDVESLRLRDARHYTTARAGHTACRAIAVSESAGDVR